MKAVVHSLFLGSVICLTQYTPDQANWTSFYDKNVGPDHTPDSVSWLKLEDWKPWDGTTVYNPVQMTKDEFFKAICPHVDAIRGIRQLFYKTNPFANVTRPTKAEVDEWHRIALNHVRAMIGYTSADRLVTPDHCMFARALWGQERMRSTIWDTKYPDGQALFLTHTHTHTHSLSLS